jgi:hypothetical protein
VAIRTWADEDDLVAMFICRYGADRLGVTVEEAARRIGKPVGSLRMRVSNFRAFYSGHGLGNYGVRPARLDGQFGKLSEAELLERVLRHLGVDRAESNGPAGSKP